MPSGHLTIRRGRLGICAGVLAALVCAGSSVTFAQDNSVIITGQNFRSPELLGVGSEFPNDPAKISLAAGQELMLWIERGKVAIVVQNGAVFSIDATDQIKLNLESGRLLITAGQVKEGDQPVHVQAGDGDDLQFDLPVPQGTTVVVRAGKDVDIGRLDGPSGPVTLTLPEEEVELEVDDHVSIRNGTVSRDKASGWMTDGDVAKMATNNLGFGAAKSWRGKVCGDLFSSLAYWDKTAQTNPVALLPAVPENKVEPRTITAQIAVPPAGNQSAQNRPNIINFVGANEVPSISPAAISVGGAGAVGANNAEARSLLSLTGSQGLGFGGLSLLGIRGTSSGIRAIGPAGLGGP